jgi:hypothetical protein
MAAKQTKWTPIGITNPLTHGDHVKQAQSLLDHNPFGNFRPGPHDGVAGRIFEHAVLQAKYELGYPKKNIVAIFGPTLHSFLTGDRALTHEMHLRRVRRLAAKPAQTPRTEMVKWCEWGISHEGEIHYAPVRPIVFSSPGHLPLTTDCSGSTILFAKWAGVPAHGGLQYNGAGSSFSLSAGLRHISWGDTQNGDLVCWPAHHVAVVIDKSNSMLESHGMERGPLRISLADEAAYHRSHGQGEPVFLSLL